MDDEICQKVDDKFIEVNIVDKDLTTRSVYMKKETLYLFISEWSHLVQSFVDNLRDRDNEIKIRLRSDNENRLARAYREMGSLLVNLADDAINKVLSRAGDIVAHLDGYSYAETEGFDEAFNQLDAMVHEIRDELNKNLEDEVEVSKIRIYAPTSDETLQINDFSFGLCELSARYPSLDLLRNEICPEELSGMIYRECEGLLLLIEGILPFSAVPVHYEKSLNDYWIKSIESLNATNKILELMLKIIKWQEITTWENTDYNIRDFVRCFGECVKKYFSITDIRFSKAVFYSSDSTDRAKVISEIRGVAEKIGGLIYFMYKERNNG